MRKRTGVMSGIAVVGILGVGIIVGQIPKENQSLTISTSQPSLTLPPVNITPSNSPIVTAKYKDGTFVGSSENSRYGTITFQVNIANGIITNASASPTNVRDGHSEEINNQAIPILNSEVIKSQSSKISNVSGATYTSTAYQNSLQAALDKAKN